MIKRHFLWILYAVFVALAIVFKGEEALFISEGPYGLGKLLVWAVLALFLIYSLHCHVKEDFFKTMSITAKYYWTKQIGLDLYLGAAMFCGLIYFNEGSIIIMLVWFVPILIFANLATLLYLALNYDSIVAHFILQ
jgi:hypothetical protein